MNDALILVEPTDNEQPKLRVLNTFTGQKELFVPVNPHEVTWYTCGPTVYDDSHMGHARTYISFDILRRIMTDYFGYNVKVSKSVKIGVSNEIFCQRYQRTLQY